GGNLLVRVQLADGVVLPELAGELLSLVDLPVVLQPVGSGDSRTGRLSATDDEDVFELMFKGLVPGDYRLALELPGGIAASFSPALPLVTTVLERETTTETITLTSIRSEEHTSELQSRENLVCRLLLEKKKKTKSSRQL